MQYLWAFLIGGAFCTIGQVLIDKTKLTPARILVLFVVVGVVLGGLGVYDYIKDVGGAGATVPLTGFGNLLSEGVREAVDEKGLLGAFTGGLTACAGGVTAAMTAALVAALLFRSKSKA
ncbi:MAG: stage V sporulation protein AE [Oscillospiraceae bacterium]|nr:stage V sporulation protein AE [Oscillospiraceae bacterium]